MLRLLGYLYRKGKAKGVRLGLGQSRVQISTPFICNTSIYSSFGDYFLLRKYSMQLYYITSSAVINEPLALMTWLWWSLKFETVTIIKVIRHNKLLIWNIASTFCQLLSIFEDKTCVCMYTNILIVLGANVM